MEKWTMELVTLTLLYTLLRSNAFPVDNEQNAKLYLQKYGYLDESIDNTRGFIVHGGEMTLALKKFQRFAGLNQTGKLDNHTVAAMNAPRCGLKDIENDEGLARRKRYALQGSRWKPNHLLYSISKYPSHLNDKQKVDKEIARAFKVWSDVTGLVFEQRKDRRGHIGIGFEGGSSEVHHTFDGPGNILAYAKYPLYGGEVRFDDEEDWSIGQPEGINIFQVAVHELGHALGLYHSNNIKSAMAPRYDGYNPSFKLHEDDITGIRILYGLYPEAVKPSS